MEISSAISHDLPSDPTSISTVERYHNADQVISLSKKMGQYFELLNLDNPAQLHGSATGKFGEMFMDPNPDLCDALWQPEGRSRRFIVRPLKDIDVRIIRLSKQSPTNNPEKNFATELIEAVLECIERVEDLVCFAMTCQRYFEISRPYLEAHLEEALTISWAGNRLICVGDYTEMGDLPQGMLTESELQILQQKFSGNPSNDDSDDSDDSDDDRYDESDSDGDEDSICSRLFYLQGLHPASALNQMKAWYHKEYTTGLKGFLADFHDRMTFIEFSVLKYGKIFEARRSEFYSSSYVLRNLTTKEYVRKDAIYELSTPQEPWFDEIGFEHVLNTRITWSSRPNLNIAYNGPLEIHRGVWAGHRFDISRIETVRDEEGPKDGWKDVSFEVWDEVLEIFTPEADAYFS